MVTFTSDRNGFLYTTSQVEDYQFRGASFSDMNFLDFLVETYEIQKLGYEDVGMVEEVVEGNRKGRKKNVRSSYNEGHRKHLTHERIQRTEGHTYMPNIVGHWFPRRDVEEEEDFYFASILAFLKPWRNFTDLKDDSRTWKEEGLLFVEGATTSQRDVIAGMQYYYDSKHAAQCHREDNDAEDEGLDDGLMTTGPVDDDTDMADVESVSLFDLSNVFPCYFQRY